MKMTSKKMMAVVGMMTAMLLAPVFEANAQARAVQSISSKKAEKVVSSEKKDPNIAWGTEFDFLSTRFIDRDDIKGLDRSQLRVLRNSIYARHGRMFKDKGLRDFFNKQRWYRGTRLEIPANELNKYEKANIAFLQKHE